MKVDRVFGVLATMEFFRMHIQIWIVLGFGRGV